jgi:hypothetical protein
MNMRLAAVLGLVIFLGIGCSPPPEMGPSQPPDDGKVGTATGGGLTVTVRLAETQLMIGEEFRVGILATNRTNEDLHISSGTGAPYSIHLYQQQETGWERIRTYPESTDAVQTDWVLPAGASRAFRPTLIAEPHWPTYTNLRLAVCLNGREDVQPFVHIEVVKPEKMKD